MAVETNDGYGNGEVIEHKKEPMNTAQEILASRASISFIDIISRFKNEINSTELAYFGVHLSDDVKLQLMNLGFRYRKHIDPIGLTVHIISVI